MEQIQVVFVKSEKIWNFWFESKPSYMDIKINKFIFKCFKLQIGLKFYSNYSKIPKKQNYNFRFRFFTIFIQQNAVQDLRKIKIQNDELKKYIDMFYDEVSEIKFIDFSEDPDGVDAQIALEKRISEILLINTILKKDVELTILELELKIEEYVLSGLRERETPALRDDLFIQDLTDFVSKHQRLDCYDKKIKTKVVKEECLKYIFGVLCENKANLFLKNKSFYLQINNNDLILQKSLEDLFEKNYLEILKKFKKSNNENFKNKVDIVFEFVILAYSHIEFQESTILTKESVAIEVIIKFINNLKKLEQNNNNFVCYFELSRLQNEDKFKNNEMLDAQTSMLNNILKNRILNQMIRSRVKNILTYHCKISSYFENNVGQNKENDTNYILKLFDFVVKDEEIKKYKINKRIFILKTILNFVVSFLLKQKVVSQTFNPKALELHTYLKTSGFDKIETYDLENSRASSKVKEFLTANAASVPLIPNAMSAIMETMNQTEKKFKSRSSYVNLSKMIGQNILNACGTSIFQKHQKEVETKKTIKNISKNDKDTTEGKRRRPVNVKNLYSTFMNTSFSMNSKEIFDLGDIVLKVLIEKEILLVVKHDDLFDTKGHSYKIKKSSRKILKIRQKTITISKPFSVKNDPTIVMFNPKLELFKKGNIISKQNVLPMLCKPNPWVLTKGDNGVQHIIGGGL